MAPRAGMVLADARVKGSRHEVVPPSALPETRAQLRYIGSKARIVDELVRIMGPGRGWFADAMCGSGSVSKAAMENGWHVHANDFLLSAATITEAQLISDREARFEALGGYEAAINHLNGRPGEKGFIWREYAQSGQSESGHERLYFSAENALRIDGIRMQISLWRENRDIEAAEYQLLLADLILAANRVANTAGTFGCFLRELQPNAQRPMKLARRNLAPARSKYTASCSDVMDLRFGSEETIYIDPPYTKRQYAAYYHVLETIAAGDEPNVGGKTGLRPWDGKDSPFCHRKKAPHALRRLLAGIGGRRIFLSYSSEGHMSLETVEGILSEFGDVVVHLVREIGRYRPNVVAGRNGSSVREYLLEVTRGR